MRGRKVSQAWIKTLRPPMPHKGITQKNGTYTHTHTHTHTPTHTHTHTHTHTDTASSQPAMDEHAWSVMSNRECTRLHVSAALDEGSLGEGRVAFHQSPRSQHTNPGRKKSPKNKSSFSKCMFHLKQFMAEICHLNCIQATVHFLGG